MRNILVLLAHPALDRSEANAALIPASRSADGVTLVDLYAEYPDFRIDIDREQQRLRDHDVVIFQHPFYWYSTPSILKEWQDLVLEHGFAYGHGGEALHGKYLMNALTAGGPEDAYQEGGYNHFTLRELLRPFEQTANLCGMHYLAPLALFHSRTAAEEGRLIPHVQLWIKLLRQLRNERLDLDAALHAATINPLLGED